AAEGLEPKAELAYEVPVWDQLALIASDMADEPGLIAGVLGALADPMVVEPHPQPAGVTAPPKQHLGETISAFLQFRDRYVYDRNDVNGPSVNQTDGDSLRDPQHEVDRQASLNGENVSMFQRSLRLIADSNGLKFCNKQGAKVPVGAGEVRWPLVGDGYEPCELFQFDNVGAYYLNTLLPRDHRKRSELVLRNRTLESLFDVIGIFTSQDEFLENVSGIDGLNLFPESTALHRFLFFGGESDQFGQLPDHDFTNADSDIAFFVTSTVEPMASPICDLGAESVRRCPTNDPSGLFRLRTPGTISSWERLGFTHYLRPTLRVFAELTCPDGGPCAVNDYRGESYFLDAVSVLDRHWPGPDHGDECSPDVDPSDPYYCSGAGINRYEPILSEVLAGDFVPALHEFAAVAQSVDVTYRTGPRAGQTINGLEIVELLTRMIFSQTYADSAGIRDRQGDRGATGVDGTPIAQVTPFELFADALRAMDLAFERTEGVDAGDRQSKWKRARSLMVDQFLTISGGGSDSRFANVAVPRTLSTLLRMLRQQLNAHCPDRAFGERCAWPTVSLVTDFASTVDGPTLAAVTDLVNTIERDETARRALGAFLTYALSSHEGTDALFGMLVSVGDVIQLLQNDDVLVPILNAVSVAVRPGASVEGPGAVDRTVQVLDALSDDAYDRYRVLDTILPTLVTPVEGDGRAPIIIMADVMAEVLREDARDGEAPYTEEDVQALLASVFELLTSETRGLPQFYSIIQNRTRE
ncbi:MAG: hypothetical protein AAGA56_23710, partial [Myxococcota bacterium]